MLDAKRCWGIDPGPELASGRRRPETLSWNPVYAISNTPYSSQRTGSFPGIRFLPHISQLLTLRNQQGKFNTGGDERGYFFFFCSEFCHTLKWNSHGFTCVPHPDSPSHLPLYPLPLGLPSAPGPSACLMHPTWEGVFLNCQGFPHENKYITSVPQATFPSQIPLFYLF